MQNWELAGDAKPLNRIMLLSKTDVELYEKYGLTDDEIAFIEATIKPME